MAKNRKPTNMELKTVITNLIMHVNNIEDHLRKMDAAFYSFIEFKGETKSFEDWLKNIGENKDVDKSSNESSVKGNKDSSGKV
tara:strand:+ start:390 stop:638 length:249 start_codon:yes stop_codon:yes gene_type:complete